MYKQMEIVPEMDFSILSSLSPGPTQNKLAGIVVIMFFLIFVLITAGPLSNIQIAPVNAFVPAYVTAMMVNDLITSVLLFGQFSILRSRAILVLASGYLFTALILIPWSLAFPGLFVTGRGLIGGVQTTSWLWFFWHAAFPIFVIGYALLKDLDHTKRYWPGKVSSAITFSIVLTISIISVTTFIFVVFEPGLPRVADDALNFSPLWPYVGTPVALVALSAVILLWIRRRSMIDLWLMVVMFTYVIEVPLTYYPLPSRHTLAFYIVRGIAVISSGLVLTVLLYEITTLYSRLVNAVRAQNREREARLMTGEAVAVAIAHEIKQPLATMVTNADAGWRFLNRSIPDVNEAKIAFTQISDNGRRAGAMIGSVRALFKTGDQTKVALDLNDLIEDTLAVVRGDFVKHQILVRVELDRSLPKIAGDRIQLQQLLINLIANAIDSMVNIEGSRVLSVKSAIDNDIDVRVSVADTGAGIGPEDIERIFNPLFTTKSGGMGIGLAICRSIVEAHAGRLWVSPNTPHGAVFHVCIVRSVPM
jgi:signal transduction histidine kinase